MQVKIEPQTEKTVHVIVENEDYSIADVIRLELLQQEGVVFAGVVPPHPLLKKLVVKIQMSRRDPLKALVESGTRAAQTMKEILESAEKAVAKPPEK